MIVSHGSPIPPPQLLPPYLGYHQMVQNMLTTSSLNQQRSWVATTTRADSCSQMEDKDQRRGYQRQAKAVHSLATAVGCAQWVETASHFILFYACNEADGCALYSTTFRKLIKKYGKSLQLFYLSRDNAQRVPNILAIKLVAEVLIGGMEDGQVILYRLPRERTNTSRPFHVQRISQSAITQIQPVVGLGPLTHASQKTLVAFLTSHQEIVVAAVPKSDCQLVVIWKMSTVNASLLILLTDPHSTSLKSNRNLVVQATERGMRVTHASKSGVLKIWQLDGSQVCVAEHGQLVPLWLNSPDLLRCEGFSAPASNSAKSDGGSKIRHSTIPDLLVASLFAATSVLEICSYGDLFLFVTTDGYLSLVSLSVTHPGLLESIDWYERVWKIKIFEGLQDHACDPHYEEDQFAGIEIDHRLIYVLVNRMQARVGSRSGVWSHSRMKRITLDRNLNVSCVQSSVMRGLQEMPAKFRIVNTDRMSSCSFLHARSVRCCCECGLIVLGAQSVCYYDSIPGNWECDKREDQT